MIYHSLGVPNSRKEYLATSVGEMKELKTLFLKNLILFSNPSNY